MQSYIKISNINDFLFCPASIYFHFLYEYLDTNLYHQKPQIIGNFTHKSIDFNSYSTKKSDLQAIDVVSNKYRIVGKIDIYHQDTKILVERKTKIKTVHVGYIFQLYAQYLCMTEMGYEINKLKLYSYQDNKNYFIDLPDASNELFQDFTKTIMQMNQFDVGGFNQSNKEKCKNCIYKELCFCGGEYVI